MTRNSTPTLDRGFDGRSVLVVEEKATPERKQPASDEKKRVPERRVLPVPSDRKAGGADLLPDLLRAPAPPSPHREDAGKTEERATPAPARKPSQPEPDALATGCMACPTPLDGPAPMLQQQIPASMCERRQTEGFHRCSGCSLRKRPMFEGRGLPPLENSPAHLQHARLIGLFGSEGERFRR